MNEERIMIRISDGLETSAEMAGGENGKYRRRKFVSYRIESRLKHLNSISLVL
jgi:hypothetical protein